MMHNTPMLNKESKTTVGGKTAPNNNEKTFNTTTTSVVVVDIDRLEFPKALSSIIGLRKETISYWKKLGCRFVGRKTSVRWVREFMNTISGGDNHGIA